MGERRSGAGEPEGRRPQLQIWDEDVREHPVGTLPDDGGPWDVALIVESVSPRLVRGRLSFRRGEEAYRTAPVLVEPTAEEVERRAEELPQAMLRQLLLSARD